MKKMFVLVLVLCATLLFASFVSANDVGASTSASISVVQCSYNDDCDLFDSDCAQGVCNASNECEQVLKSSATICRSAGICDANEFCDGVNVDCPADVNQPDGTNCGDGLFCNGDETCQAGVCRGGVTRDCSDGVGCTVDSCNEAT